MQAAREHSRERPDVIRALDDNVVMNTLGMCMSGFDASTLALHEELSENSLDLFRVDKLRCANDTLSSLFAGTGEGGICIISGTGSNCGYFDAHGRKIVQIGGWGHVVGDEGSCFFLGVEAIRRSVRGYHGFPSWPKKGESLHPADYYKAVFEAVMTHFSFQDVDDVLSLCDHFDKAKIAQLTINVFRLSETCGDPFAEQCVRESTFLMSRNLAGVLFQVFLKMPELKKTVVQVVCVGSMWKSWVYVSKWFLYGLYRVGLGGVSLRLVFVQGTASGGSAAYGALELGVKLNISRHVLVLFEGSTPKSYTAEQEKELLG